MTAPDPSPFDPLLALPFVLTSMTAAIDVAKALGDKPARLAPTYSRDPDEHEFYLLNVGSTLSHMFTGCDHLRSGPVMMANFRTTPELTRRGISRRAHVIFHAESYLVRVGGVFDRTLRLVNDVFHLGNEGRNCGFSIVTKNARVAHYPKVVQAIKALKRITDRYAEQRNEVVHANPIQDQDLRLVELFELVKHGKELEGDDTKARGLDREINDMLRTFCREKRQEFERFNVEVAQALEQVLEVLAPRYEAEESALRLKLGKVASA